MIGPITPDRAFYMAWNASLVTLGIVVILAAVFAFLWFCGPSIIARGLELWLTMSKEIR